MLDGREASKGGAGFNFAWNIWLPGTAMLSSCFLFFQLTRFPPRLTRPGVVSNRGDNFEDCVSSAYAPISNLAPSCSISGTSNSHGPFEFLNPPGRHLFDWQQYPELMVAPRGGF